jgi:hypothetical protein
MPELGKPVHPILEELETLKGRQAKGPLDQGEVNPVGRLLGPGSIRRRLGGSGRRLGHESTIARPEIGQSQDVRLRLQYRQLESQEKTHRLDLGKITKQHLLLDFCRQMSHANPHPGCWKMTASVYLFLNNR